VSSLRCQRDASLKHNGCIMDSHTESRVLLVVATRSTVEKFRWWYALWGQSTDKALPPIGCGCTGPEAVTLLSADFSKEVMA